MILQKEIKLNVPFTLARFLRDSLSLRLPPITGVYFNFFTLTFRALGRKCIASTPARAIATLGGSTFIPGAAPNCTITSSINFMGSTTVDGRCSGTQYSARMAPVMKWLYEPPSETLLTTMRFR